ncbi:transcriptional regulator ATRX-like isoform X1 [Lytechinus pictus]|uniref:transcriptional regulator ATRX-like isoform X1 n=1 Tax=Lytechinus pictus TaxID=7653 RepID=UPI0030B9F314
MVLTIMLPKVQEGARRRKPAFTRKVSTLKSNDSKDGCPNPSDSAVIMPVRKPHMTRRIVSSESDSSESIPDPFINQPSQSRTPIEKTKKEKTRIGGSVSNSDSKKNNFVRLNGSTESSDFRSKRAINALTGVNNGFVYQLIKKKEENSEEGESDCSKDAVKKCNGSLVDSTFNEEIPEGTVIVQPEAASDGEEDWYKSKEFRKQFPRERRERRDANNQNAPQTIESVFCTACTTQVNPFDKRTFCSHPILSVVFCKGCMEFYNSGPWKTDEDGIEEECRWCGQGGSLSCCDFCCKTFCKRCIMRNLGRAEWNRTLSKKKWKCYVCDPSPIRELVAKCSALLLHPVKTDKKEKEKANVLVQKKVAKAPKNEKKEKEKLKMHDAAIAEEFLQYLVGNITNRALFMRSLVRLKKEVPDMQRLQMNLSLKHIAEVKSVLGEFQACVKRQLHGDIHKSDSALDGTDPEDCDSPERRSKSQMEGIVIKTEKKEVVTGQKGTAMEEKGSAMDTTAGHGVKDADIPLMDSSAGGVNECENVDESMDTGETNENVSSKGESEQKENDVKISQNSPIADVEMDGNDGDDEDYEDKESSEDSSNDKELIGKEQAKTSSNKESKPDPVNEKQTGATPDKTKMDVQENTGCAQCEDSDCPSSQHSVRKMKVTPVSPRTRKESQAEDEEAKLMSMINESNDESSDESDGSEYSPKKSTRSPKKSPAKARNRLSRKFSKAVKKEPVSSDDSDHHQIAKQREGPGEDSSNPEEQSGFDGIPGGESSVASQDEEVENGEVQKKKDSSAVTRKSKHSSESSKSESSEDISESNSVNNDRNTKSRRKRRSRKKKKCEPQKMDSASEEEMELKRLEGIKGLKRKRDRVSDSDGESEDVPEAQDKPEDIKAEGVVNEKEKSDVEKESESDEAPPKKAKKVRKSPAKIDPKSREVLSTDTSSDDDESESDDCSGLRWKSLNKKSKKKGSSLDMAETLLMDELDGDDEDEDDDEEDDDEEVDGAGSKRSKKKAQKKAEEEEPEEEDEDWDTNESRQNGTGGGGGDGDGKKGGDDKKKNKKGKDKDDEEDEEEEKENFEENGEEENGEDDETLEDESEEEGTKKSHPLLRVQISTSSEDEKDEDISKKKKKGTKGKAAPKKRGKATKKKRRKEIDTDDFVSSSESDDVSDEKPKRKRVTRSQTATSTEDSADDLKRPKKRRAKKEDPGTSSDADSNKESKPKKRGGKGKKRRRIKVASDSDTEGGESKTQDESQEEKKGSDGSSGDENDSPSKKGRKTIRRVLKKSKLQAETLAAEMEEQERRKRIEEKRKEIINEEEEKAEKSAVVKTCILEKDKESDDVVLEVDERIVAHLKPHQAEGIQFIFDSTFESVSKAEEKGGGCILAHCMGLGKTLQVISYLHTIMTNDDLDVKTCLVVAPLNTVLNWEDEFEKWIGDMDSGINVYEMSAVKNNASRADYLDHWHKKGGVMIMGYAMYRNLSLLTHIRKKKLKAVFLKTLVDPGPDIVVCDEGHMLKNESSAISKAMNNIKTLRRICLTGTPLQNNLIEYHCMVHFVKPNLLGTMREFKNRFVNPITNGQHSDSTARDVKIMKRRAHVLHNLLSGCVQRKDYTALTKFLPPKHEFVINVRLSEVQIKLYEHYLNTLSGRKDDGTKTQCTSLFADYQSLMNVWTHPRLLQLATQREDRNAAKREMDDFVTSEEEEDDDDSMKAFVISSDSDLEDPWKSSKKRADKSSSNSPRPRSSRRGQNNSDSDDDISGEDKNDGNNSDSSVEVVKSWNTRSRAKEVGLSEGASTSAAEVYIPPEPEKVTKWYSEFFSEDDAFKVEFSGKLVLLFEILKMAESVGEKVLVFSQSLLSLDMIEDMLAHLDEKAQEERADGEQDLENQIGGTGSWIKGEDYFRMDGSTAAHLRRRWSEIFNDLDNIRARLFLISTRAGSLGTNLIAANRVIIFDANWNPSHDIQSIFRVYRFGQERAVFIYRFIAQGTMEEKIYDRQVIKQSLSQRVVDEHQIERHFTSADLSELYNFTPDRLDDPNRPERPTPVLPKDYFLAELLKTQSKWIVKYHEHDSLLENQMEEELTEEERKEAWNDYDAEKNRQFNMPPPRQIDPQDMERFYQEGQSILRMGEMALNYQGQPGMPPMVGASGSAPQASTMQRLLEMQSMYRAQIQQQQRQQQMQREQQQLQRLLMLQQARELPNSASSSASMQQLQRIALLQQQQQQQRLQEQMQRERFLSQNQANSRASSSEGKAP